MSDNGSKLLFAVGGALITICMGLITWNLTSTQQLREQTSVMQYQIEQLRAGRDIDVEQNRRLTEQRETCSKFWRLHRWARDEINRLRVAAGSDIVTWPTPEEEP